MNEEELKKEQENGVDTAATEEREEIERDNIVEEPELAGADNTELVDNTADLVGEADLTEEAELAEETELAGDEAEIAEEPENEPVESEPEPEKMIPQSQVNKLVGEARAEGRASALKELYGRYGVNDDNEMNDMFGKGQGYDLLNDEYSALNGKYSSVAAENALLKSGVLENRWDDVKAILGSKNMDITVENIAAEMATHPEWGNRATKEFTPEMGENFAQVAQTSTIRKLGSNTPEPKVDDEEAKAMKMFGL